MNILFDIGHPAHVHLFRNFIDYLKKNNHNVIIATRKKDITEKLLDHYNLEYHSLSSPRKSLLGMFIEMIERDYKILKLHRRYSFDYAFGTSISIGILSLFSNVKSFNFNEDDDDVVPLYALIAYPLTTKIINSKIIRMKGYKKKRIYHNSYHKLAYLHPNNFSADLSVLNKYNLKPFDYVIVRKSALLAHHDKNAKGLDDYIWVKIFEIFENYKIISSFENYINHQIDIYDMHNVLAFSKMMITDSLSMAVEAAVLGVPTVALNSFSDRSSVLKELEERYHLLYSYKAGDKKEEGRMVNKINVLLNIRDLHEVWHKKRKNMLNEKEDLNKWIINFFENKIHKNIYTI